MHSSIGRLNGDIRSGNYIKNWVLYMYIVCGHRCARVCARLYVQAYMHAQMCACVCSCIKH